MVIAVYFLYFFLLLLACIVLFLCGALVIGAWRARTASKVTLDIRLDKDNDESVSDAQMRAAAALACFQTGKPVVANRDANGNVTLTVVDRNER